MPTTLKKAHAETNDPVANVRSRADALCRTALECCRQHDRRAKLVSDDDDVERKHVEAMCHTCDGSLTELVDEYKAATASLTSPIEDDWFKKAGTLWQSSREYIRRHAGCDALAKSITSKHNKDQLAGMQLEYELEASALLALRHAAEAYKKTRPGLI